MNQPSVSIIIPVYNVEPYVEDCIKSVMRQTYDGSMECIVVDDCGMDNSMAVVERLIAEYHGPIMYKILHHDHNRGLSAARNTGMDAAIGDYLFFLDSDDEITDDCIEKLTGPLKTEWYDVIMGNVQCYMILSSGQQERVNSHLELHFTDDIQLDFPMMMQTIYHWHNMTAWNRLFRMDFIRQHHLRFKEGLLYEDQLWSFEIACLASSFYVLNHITYHYKLREGCISYPHDEQKYLKNLKIIIQEMSLFIDHYHIDKKDIFGVYRLFFSWILNSHSSSVSDYVSTYKTYRPFVKAPLSYIIHMNGFHIKAYFHDLHFMLPAYIAPYWQYLIHNTLCRVISLIQYRIHE